jgi:ABC-type nitrate/sulfonate/bicarbonate transport system substrate-binding protein
LTAASASLSGLGLSGPAFGQAAPVVVRDGVQRGAIGAIKSALLEVGPKHGLTYDLKTFNDATAVILAMAQKELEMGNVTAQHVVRAIDQGIDLSVVVGWGGGYNVLVTNPDVALKKDDIAGFKALVASRKAANNKLKIGTPTGSQQHLKLIYFLKENKVDADKDVDVINVTFPDHPRALDGRQVDMVMTLAPFASLAIVKGSGKLFYHVYGKSYGQWEIGFAVRRDLIKDKPDLVQKIVDSHVDGMKMFMDDMPKRLELEKRQSGFPPPVIEMEQRDFLKLTYKVAINDIKRTAREMAEVGWVKRDLSGEVDKYVDLRFLEKTTGLSKAQLSVF